MLALDAVAPTPEESQLARSSGRALAHYVSASAKTQTIRMVHGRKDESITVPAEAFRLLVDILAHMAKGRAVTVIPMNAELTTQQAADLLNVSRPYLIGLLDERKIPYTKVGTHRRIRFSDLQVYKRHVDQEREKILDELAALGQEMERVQEDAANSRR